MEDLLTGPLYNLVFFLIIISILVFIHEFGHYYIAKISKVKIEVFSIGLGPEIFGWTDKSGTRWKICYIPLGGYVKMFGDKNISSQPDQKAIKELAAEEKKYAFHTKSLGVRAAIVVAGPAANYIFAIVVLAFFYGVYGSQISLPVVSGVIEGSAAQRAGIIAGDKVISVDGEEVDKYADIKRIIGINVKSEVSVTIDRGGQIIDKIVSPDITKNKNIFGEEVKTAKLGIYSTEYKNIEHTVPESIWQATKDCWVFSASTVEAVGQMIVGSRSADELSGIIRIAKYSGQSAKKGIKVVLWFMAILSINLGLINLFPIPMLDGGHLFFYLIEFIKGSPVSEKYQKVGFQIGFTMVILLAIFATFNDIKSLNLF